MSVANAESITPIREDTWRRPSMSLLALGPTLRKGTKAFAMVVRTTSLFPRKYFVARNPPEFPRDPSGCRINEFRRAPCSLTPILALATISLWGRHA